MPEILLVNEGLTIELPGTVTVIADSYVRKLKVVSLTYNIENKIVRVEGVMAFYLPDGTDVKDSLVAKPYAVSITATNNDLCDATTGEQLCKVVNEYLDAEKTQLNPVLAGKNYAKQFDWFFHVGATSPVVINNMIQQFLLAAVSKGQFN